MVEKDDRCKVVAHAVQQHSRADRFFASPLHLTLLATTSDAGLLIFSKTNRLQYHCIDDTKVEGVVIARIFGTQGWLISEYCRYIMYSTNIY